MAKRPSRGFLVLVLAAAALLACRRPGVALVEKGKSGEEAAPPPAWQAEVARVGRFWEQPHRFGATHGGFRLSSISQGKDQWQLSISEEGALDRPGAFVSQENGGTVAYGLEYDSTKSNYSLADMKGLKLKRVAFSAASKSWNGSNLDWALHVEGDKGRQFSATGDKDHAIYDGSFGVEVPVATGVALRYAFDAKRRAGTEGVLPAWFRHSAGVKYISELANATLLLHQPNPDLEKGPFEYQAVLEGDIRSPKVRGSPSYTLQAAREGGALPSYDAKVKMQGPEGLTGGLMAGLRGGKPVVSAFGEYATKRTVAKGIQVGGDAKVVLSPKTQEGSTEVVEIHPVGLSASADLAQLVPSLADTGSSLDLRTRYKLGAKRPAVSASATLGSKQLAALRLAAEASMDDIGASSGKLKLSGSVRGVAGAYEAVATAGQHGLRQVAQVVWPAELKRGRARTYGRLLHNGAFKDSKPRLQLGVQYDFDTNVAGREVRVQGESAAYDSGGQLLGEDNAGWHDTRLHRARLHAATLRRRIEGGGSESHKWLHH